MTSCRLMSWLIYIGPKQKHIKSILSAFPIEVKSARHGNPGSRKIGYVKVASRWPVQIPHSVCPGWRCPMHLNRQIVKVQTTDANFLIRVRLVLFTYRS
jgi:hypothetical protein